MNTRTPSFFLLSLFLLLTSCITVLKHAEEDGYKLADKSELSAFNSDSTNESDSFRITEIKAEELKEMISGSEKTLVVLWASWCGHCHLEMPGMLEKAKSQNIVFVSVDYNLVRIKKFTSATGYKKPTYIISAPVYGTDEKIKTNTFLKELTNNADSVAVFPKHLFFENGELQAVIPGRITPHQVDSLFAK